MKKKFIYIILLLFIFINKVHAENINKTKGEKNVLYSSKNEVILSKDNYLVVGNYFNDFNSIKYFADKYCSNILGDNYKSSLVQISNNVAYAYCLMIDELKQYNLTPIERNCYLSFELSVDFFYDRYCKKIQIDFNSILTEVKKYKTKINVLSSDAFIYNMLNEDLSNKISNFETNIQLSKQTKVLRKRVSKLENPLQERIDTIIINRNIQLCNLYEFIEGTELYFECILSLMGNHTTTALEQYFLEFGWSLEGENEQPNNNLFQLPE